MNKFLTVLAFLYLIVFVSCSGSSESSSDGEEHEVEKRKLDIQINGGEVQIEGESESSTFKDHLSLKCKTQSNSGYLFRFDFEYKDEREDGKRDDSTKVSFDFELQSIVEFTNSAGGAVYTPGTSTVLNTYSPSQVWTSWSQTSRTVGTVTIYDFSANTVDGVLTLRLHIADGAVVDNGVTYTPNSLKFDIDVAAASVFNIANGNLALVTKLHSESEIEDEQESGSNKRGSGEDRFKVTSAGLDVAAGALVWTTTVNIDGGKTSTVTYASTSSSGTGSTNLIFSIAGPSTTYSWDPATQVAYNSGSALSSWLSFF